MYRTVSTVIGSVGFTQLVSVSNLAVAAVLFPQSIESYCTVHRYIPYVFRPKSIGDGMA